MSGSIGLSVMSGDGLVFGGGLHSEGAFGGSPEGGAELVGGDAGELVGGNDAFHHVGQDGHPGTATDQNRNLGAAGFPAAKGARHAEDAGRTAKTGGNEPLGACLGTKRSGGVNKTSGRCLIHTPTMTGGCYIVERKER